MWRSVPVVLVAMLVFTAVAYSDGSPELLAQRGGAGRGGVGGRRGPGVAPAGIRTLVEGHVTAIDAASGAATLDLAGTAVEARFPAERIGGMKPGDTVFVTVELIDTRLATVSGAVTAVDAATGAVTVATPRGPWTLSFSPGAVRDVATGDPAVLKLDVVDVGPSQ